MPNFQNIRTNYKGIFIICHFIKDYENDFLLHQINKWYLTSLLSFLKTKETV